MKGKQEIFALIDASTEVETLQVLFTGAELRTAQDERGRTVLHKCSEVGNVSLLRLFLEAKYRVLADLEGNTPLQVAVLSQQWEAALELTSNWKTCLAAMKNKSGFTALHTMARVVDDSNDQALGCLSAFCKQFKHLLNDKASSAAGETPLIIACARPSVPIAKTLLEAGASVSAEDKASQTPYNHALNAGCEPLLELLREHGAGAQSLANKLASTPSPKRQLGSSGPAAIVSSDLLVATKRTGSLDIARTDLTVEETPEAEPEERTGRTPKLRRSISVKTSSSAIRSPRKSSKTRKSRTRSKNLTSLLVPRALEIEVSAAEPAGRTALFDTAAAMSTDVFSALTAPPGDIMAKTKADVVVLFLLNSYIVEELGSHEVSLDLLPFSVVSDLKVEAEARFLGEVPVNSAVSVASKVGPTVVAVPITRHFSVAPAHDCIYSATYASLCQVVASGAKKILFVLPKLSCMAWSPYPGNSMYQAAIFQMEQACLQFTERNTPEFSVDHAHIMALHSRLTNGPFTTKAADAEVLSGLLSMGKLVDRGIQNEQEVNWLLRESEEGSQEAIACLGQLVALGDNKVSAQLRTFMKQKILTTPQVLGRLLDGIQSGAIPLQTTLSMDDVEIGGRLGTGATATVYHGKFKGQEVAVKVFHEGVDVTQLKRELTLMLLLEHPLLVSMIGAYVPPDSTRGNCALVLEYAERGCLYDILREPTYQEISWKKRMDMAIMVATSMEFLHTYGIVHRDLKSLNILVTKDMTLKLTDYGTSRLVSDHMTQNVGTVAWIAPEVLESQNYTEMADVYSFGMLLYELASSKAPYSDLKSYQIPQKVVRGSRPNFDKSVPKKWQKLAKRCWHGSPGKRPTFTKIIAMLNQMRSSSL